MDNTLVLNNKDTGTSFKLHPQKFALWLFMVSVVMLFAAFTSYYAVEQANSTWVEFDLPSMFDYTTMTVVISSVLMHISYIFAKKDEIFKLKVTLMVTFAAGVAFLAGQFYAWVQLVDQGVYLTGHPMGGIIYILSGVHGFHLVSGLIFLLIVVVAAFRYKVHAKSLVRIEMCATYWHFLGGLWIYLYLFLTLNH